MHVDVIRKGPAMTDADRLPAEDWLGALLQRFDHRWMPVAVGLAVDDADRSGLVRISADDTDARLSRMIEVYQQERDGLLRFAQSRLGTNRDTAEDVLQEVLRKICTKPPELREPEKASAFLYRAVANEATTIGTRAGREQQRRTDDPEAAARVPDGHAQFEDPVLFHLLLVRALARLSPRERAVVELVDVRRLTHAEAAEELGIAVGTVKNFRFVALRKLRNDPDLGALRPAA